MLQTLQIKSKDKELKLHESFHLPNIKSVSLYVKCRSDEKIYIYIYSSILFYIILFPFKLICAKNELFIISKVNAFVQLVKYNLKQQLYYNVNHTKF